MQGRITEIQHSSVHDGPGLRSVVFLKGCQLRCFWCHNPETIESAEQLFFEENSCIHCGRCFELCPAHQNRDGKHIILRDKCNMCGTCVENCPSKALTICGKTVSGEEVLKDLLEDSVFYRTSGGGVTISGGDPGFQPDFAAEIMRLSQQAGIHTAIETNLCYSEETLQKLLQFCDLVMADIKHIDTAKHRIGTGRGNELILENIQRITKPLILRTPVIPGFNDDPETIRAIANFAKKQPSLLYYELLTYNPLGIAKAEKLGLNVKPLPYITPEHAEELTCAALSTGVKTYLNGKEKRENNV